MNDMESRAAANGYRSSYFPARSFCAIFERDMHLLYSLALLLTAEHRLAEQCFLLAFHQCIEGPDVFLGFERAWSRRAILKQAIQLVRPKPGDSDGHLTRRHDELENTPTRLMELEPFDRFVFAMTVLEQYTVREAAALLNSVPSEVERARIRALQSIGPGPSACQPDGLAWSATREAKISATA